VRLDPSTIDPKGRLQADVCIVGAGPAGIAIALALEASNLSVLVLEAGSRAETETAQELCAGRMETVWRKKDADYLKDSRVRAFGGSTNRWFGGIRPLDPLDLEARDWVPHSGWPISYDELSRWYPAAAELVQVPVPQPFPEGPVPGPRGPILRHAPRLRTRLVHYSTTRFSRYLRDLSRAKNIRLLLKASVLRLHSNEAATHVRWAEVDVAGRAIQVQARRWVLAAGGIENARLLLLSNTEAPAGLGNDNDLVGRFFADHPQLGFVGRMLVVGFPGGLEDLAAYTAPGKDPRTTGLRSRAVFVLSPEAQREERLLGCAVHIAPPPSRPMRGKARAALFLARGLAVGGGLSETDGVLRAGLTIRAEQAPNPDSRVRLTDEVDRLGLRKVSLDWRLTDQDSASIRRTLQVFACDLGASLHGRVRLDLSAGRPWEDAHGSFNHLGTTRMADDPQNGVVDANSRVHGIANLWIAGGSVFPTSGNVHPTLTILALALRLADHLAG
jgi:choline dehydrogenase-like flavoprotein